MCDNFGFCLKFKLLFLVQSFILSSICNDLEYGCQVNPKAKVSVKLVAEAGIGTVASGVAKGNADVIQVWL